MYPEEFTEFEEFEHMLEGVDEEVFLIAAGIIGFIGVVVALVLLVGYIFQSIGLYTMAKNRGIANPWLAWLPIGYYWIAGSLADQYQYVVNGQVKNRRKILLILTIATMVLSSLVSGMTTGEVDPEMMMGLGTVGTLLNFVKSILETATFVFWQIALYDIYTSCNPEKNVLFLVLGIIFGVTVPYFLFFNRNKELGMPPRKAESEEPRGYDPEMLQYEEPWDNN